MKKLILIIVISAICLFIIPQDLYAQVVINEFQISPSSAQWIELFNKGSDTDISGWVIDDSASGSSSKYTVPSGTILVSGKCISFESGNFNWNTASADSVRLLSGTSVIEEYSYLTSPGNNISIGKATDGEGSLAILTNQSRDKYNSSDLSCLAPVTTPSPSPIQTSSKAIYKINKPKDDGGAELSNVQIYVDGEYIHHEDDEFLEFYFGHECYSGINCSLGIHTISLRKIGYSNWSETKDFQAEMDLEANPILNKQNTTSPTPVPTPPKTPTPIAASTKSPTPKITPTESPEVLGKATDSAISQNTSEISLGSTTSESANSKNPFPFLAIIPILVGIILIGISGYWVYKKQKENADILNE